MQKKDLKMPKYYIVFKFDRIDMKEHNAEKSSTEKVYFKSIKSCNMLGKTSLYFKGSKGYYVLFFNNFVADNAHKWFKVISLYKDKFNDTKNEIKKIDIGEYCDTLSWESTQLIYMFNYKKEIGDKLDLKANFNPDIAEIWLSENNV